MHPLDETPVVIREPVRDMSVKDLCRQQSAAQSLVADYPVPRGPGGRGYTSRSRFVRRECVAIVGESGSGKTMVGRCLVGA